VAVRVADLAGGVRALSAGLGAPYGVSGAALLPDGGRGGEGPLALLRIEDFAESVTYRAGRLRDELAGAGEASLVEDAESRDLWRRVRDAEPLGAEPGDAVWRVSVRPTAGPAAARAVRAAGLQRLLLDWGGGLVWIAGPPTAEAHAAVAAAARAEGGVFVLFRAPDSLRAAVAVLPDEPPPLAAIGQRVKAALDPARVLNPGRMRAGV
jgi:glycolate oxidase FAD binding subunit